MIELNKYLITDIEKIIYISKSNKEVIGNYLIVGAIENNE